MSAIWLTCQSIGPETLGYTQVGAASKWEADARPEIARAPKVAVPGSRYRRAPPYNPTTGSRGPKRTASAHRGAANRRCNGQHPVYRPASDNWCVHG